MLSQILPILSAILAALLGVWGVNYYKIRNIKAENKRFLTSLLTDVHAFSITVNGVKNQSLKLHKHEKNGVLLASEALVTPLTISLPPLIIEALGNTKLHNDLLGNIQTLKQIVDRNNGLIQGVILERSKGEAVYDEPLGDIALNYHGISTLIESIENHLNEELDHA